MKTKLLLAALAITVAVPAFAQSASTRFAIEQLNQSIDSPLERISLPARSEGLIIPTEGDAALAEAMDIVGDDVLGFVTVYPSDPTYGQDIFDQLGSE